MPLPVPLPLPLPRTQVIKIDDIETDTSLASIHCGLDAHVVAVVEGTDKAVKLTVRRQGPPEVPFTVCLKTSSPKPQTPNSKPKLQTQTPNPNPNPSPNPKPNPNPTLTPAPAPTPTLIQP